MLEWRADRLLGRQAEVLWRESRLSLTAAPGQDLCLLPGLHECHDLAAATAPVDGDFTLEAVCESLGDARFDAAGLVFRTEDVSLKVVVERLSTDRFHVVSILTRQGRSDEAIGPRLEGGCAALSLTRTGELVTTYLGRAPDLAFIRCVATPAATANIGFCAQAPFNTAVAQGNFRDISFSRIGLPHQRPGP